MSWAAGCGGDIDIEDIERGVSDGDSYTLDFEVAVGGVSGKSGEVDGVVDEEGKTAPRVPLAVFADEVIAFEGWDGRLLA